MIGSVAGSKRANPRRELGTAVVGTVAGAGLALLSASRTWSSTVQERPAPLQAITVTHSGASLMPWMTALALVGLAGAGALPATRGGVRRLVGVVMAVSGAGVAVAGAVGIARAGGWRVGWPLGVILGGLVVAVCGGRAVRRSSQWPAMGARYERAGAPAAVAAEPDDGGAPAVRPEPDGGRRAGDPEPANAEPAADRPRERASRRQGTGNVAMWDALDRGLDPTGDPEA